MVPTAILRDSIISTWLICDPLLMSAGCSVLAIQDYLLFWSLMVKVSDDDFH